MNNNQSEILNPQQLAVFTKLLLIVGPHAPTWKTKKEIADYLKRIKSPWEALHVLSPLWKFAWKDSVEKFVDLYGLNSKFFFEGWLRWDDRFIASDPQGWRDCSTAVKHFLSNIFVPQMPHPHFPTVQNRQMISNEMVATGHPAFIPEIANLVGRYAQPVVPNTELHDFMMNWGGNALTSRRKRRRAVTKRKKPTTNKRQRRRPRRS